MKKSPRGKSPGTQIHEKFQRKICLLKKETLKAEPQSNQRKADLASSSIQTVLSVPEFHRFLPCGSRTLPPVGNFTLP
jgi:hypothetical protein